MENGVNAELKRKIEDAVSEKVVEEKKRSVEIVDDEIVDDDEIEERDRDKERSFRRKCQSEDQRLWRVFCNYALKYQAEIRMH